MVRAETRTAAEVQGANLELARDLASLAVDGGSLYIGVDEKAPDGDPLRPAASRRAARARGPGGTVAGNPGAVRRVLRDPGVRAARAYGYLEVVVRASADAPHQVEGIYYGRSDTGKCRLQDQQVERLMRGREQQRHGAEDALQKLIAADPYQRRTRAHPHLFVFARPGVRRTEMCRDVIGAGAGFRPLISLRTGVVNDVVRPLYSRAPQAPASVLEALMNPQLITGGVAMTRLLRQSSAGERYHQEFRIDEDGDLSLYHACVGWDGDPVNGVPRKVLSAPKIVGAVRELIALAVAISHCTRVPGSWHIGVALTGIHGYRHQESSWPHYGPPSTDDEYVRVEHFNLAAMERTPGDVAYKLLGRLLRALRADADPAIQALLTDSAVDPAAGNLHDEEN